MGNVLVITQGDEQGRRHGEGAHVRLEISERGELVVDANVTGRVQRGARHEMINTSVVALEDIERAPKPRSSMTMSMRPRDMVLTAFDEPRVIGRVDLVNPAGEITRAVTLLERKAAS